MAEIILPHKWQPRPYQRRLWSALEGGTKRCVEIAHRRWGKDDADILLFWPSRFAEACARWLPVFASLTRQTNGASCAVRRRVRLTIPRAALQASDPWQAQSCFGVRLWGIDCLKSYQAEWDENLRTFCSQPGLARGRPSSLDWRGSIPRTRYPQEVSRRGCRSCRADHLPCASIFQANEHRSQASCRSHAFVGVNPSRVKKRCPPWSGYGKK